MRKKLLSPTVWFSLRVPLVLALVVVSLPFLLTGCMSRSLTGLTIQPGTGLTTVVPGVTAQFKAIGTYTESGHQTTTEDVTSQVSWSSTIPAVATVNSSGLATGVGIGQTNVIATIQGSFGQLTATSNIVVNTPSGSGSQSGSGSVTRTLTGVTLVPGNQTLSVTGETAQLIAIGTYNAAPVSADLTGAVTWQSSATSVATVGSALTHSAGLVTATGVGTATITALATGSDGSVYQASAVVTVTSAQSARSLTALNVSPGTQSLSTSGQSAQLTAIGTYNTSPLTANLTNTVTWQSSDTAVASVSPTGLVTAGGTTGQSTITAFANATDGSVVTATATINVTAAVTTTRTLTGLTLIPTSQTLGETGETAQFLAIGTYSAAPVTADLTSQVTWQSSDVQVATINGSGLATAVGTGTTTITALGTASDGSVVTASGTLQWPPTQTDTGGTTLPQLTIYGAGTGSGTVTGPNSISCSYTGSSNGTGTGSGTGPGTGCTATFAAGTVVTLTATPASGTVFDGWSSNCTPVAGTPTECKITMNNNTSVGAIFDPQ